MYEAVLVPTDGSRGTERAVDHAIELANRYDAALHTMSVVETRDVDSESLEQELATTYEAEAQKAIDEIIERAKAADVGTVEATVARGVPHRAILDYVDEFDVDLVVMGTHGRTGLDRYLLGSVTERVLRTADVPVLTVPLERDDAGDDD